MDGAPIDNGAVVVSGNRIANVGKFDELKTRNAGQIVDLGEQALLPGLINAHCHLDYTCLRGKIPPPKTFADWIRAINAEKAKLSPKDYLSSINEGFAEAKRFGTATIANLTAFPDLIPQIQAPIRTWWFAEMIDVRAPERANELVDLVRRRTDSLRRAIESLRSALECADMSALSKRRHVAALQTQHWGLAPHALFTASKNLYECCEEIARREDVLLTTHLAESCEEMEMFHDASGPLYEFMKAIGRSMDDCGNETPLGQFLRVRDSSTALRAARNDDGWLVAHLNELTESDFELLERSKRPFHVVHSPRSHDYFGHSQFRFERLHSLGFNICLGTDSLASNESLSLFAEMRAFQNEFADVSPEETLQMATVNPARALRQENALGKICRGGYADLVAVPFSGGEVFREIIAFEGVPWVMAHGEIS